MTPYCRVLLCATMGMICLLPISADIALSDQAPAPENQPSSPKRSSEPVQPSDTSTAKPEPPKLSTEPRSLPQSAPPTILDVRAESEWQAGHIPRATLVPLGRLVASVRDRPRDEPLVLVCRSGSRSGIGASLLAAMGFTNVANLRDGMIGWEQSRLPVEREDHALAPR